jgi:hypothetical protein
MLSFAIIASLLWMLVVMVLLRLHGKMIEKSMELHLDHYKDAKRLVELCKEALELQRLTNEQVKLLMKAKGEA